MAGAWEDYSEDEIRGLIQHQSQVLASGYTTLVSAAISGEVRHVINVELVNTSGANYGYIASVISAGTATVKRTVQLGDYCSSNNTSPSYVWGNDHEPEKPVISLDNGDYLAARGSVSGMVTANAEYWTER